MKQFNVFDEDPFFETLMHDTLCEIGTDVGVFNENLHYTGTLIEVFTYVASQITYDLLKDPKIRFCLSLLRRFFHESNLVSQSVFLLVNFINCAIEVSPSIMENNSGFFLKVKLILRQ